MYVVALLLFVGCVSPTCAQPKKEKSDSPFPDENLHTAVKKVLKHTKGPLDDKTLANVYILQADGQSIKDLTGLEKCRK